MIRERTQRLARNELREAASAKGWSLSNQPPQVWWEPRADGADHRLLGSYVDGAGHRVDVFYAFYASQGETKDAGGFGQGALVPDTDWRWLKPGPAIASASSESKPARPPPTARSPFIRSCASPPAIGPRSPR